MSEKAITRKEIFMAKAAGEKVPDITPVTREEIFLSRIAGGGSGGSGADLLNADGVIKQEHLPEGYPYKTVEEGYILEECQPIYDEDGGAFNLPDAIEGIEADNEYTVNWNGTEYKTKAVSIELEGVTTVALGNAGIFTGDESQMTDDPYAIMLVPADMVLVMGSGAVMVDLNGATSLTVSIYGKVLTYHPISEKYLTISPNTITIDYDNKTNSVTVCDKPFSWAASKAMLGHSLCLRMKGEGSSVIMFGTLGAVTMENESTVNQLSFEFRSVGMGLQWHSDGTWNKYSVS